MKVRVNPKSQNGKTPDTRFTVWEKLDAESRKKLRAIMPQDWLPPYSIQIEVSKEIDRIMREKPQPAHDEPVLERTW